MAILRATIVLAKGDEDAAALAFPVGAVALQALQVGQHAIEIGARLRDLVVDRAALRRLSAEQ